MDVRRLVSAGFVAAILLHAAPLRAAVPVEVADETAAPAAGESAGAPPPAEFAGTPTTDAQEGPSPPASDTQPAEDAEPARRRGAARHRLRDLVRSYLTGRWDRCRRAAEALEGDLALLDDQDQAQAAYVLSAAAACRPPWWETCKFGAYTEFTARVWGREIDARFSPAGEPGLRVSRAGGAAANLAWDAHAMDRPELAAGRLGEHGFTVGEATEMTVWLLLGAADHVVHTDPKLLRVRSPEDKAAAQRTQSFRAALAALDHAGPRARLALVLTALDALSTADASDEVSDRPLAAIGAMVVEAVLAEPSRWPSLAPDGVPAGDDAERAAGRAIAARVGSGWTLAEDRAIRLAVRRFAEANPAAALGSGEVVLPSGRRFAFDRSRDEPHLAVRRAWLRERLKQAGGAGA